MHNAPPVVYPVGRFVWGSWIMGGLALVGLMGLVFWWVMASPGWLQAVVGGLVWSGSVAAAAVYWPSERSPEGRLVWSGEDWLWREASGTEIPVRVQVLLDAGRFMGLVYAGREAFDSRGQRPQFAVVCQAMMPSSWHGFRCAVYSRPISDSGSTARHGSQLEI